MIGYAPGPWFRKFKIQHKWHEILVLVYTAAISLVIGTLQPHPKPQATAAATICVSMLVYTMFQAPYNETLRAVTEVLSSLFFTTAICLVMLSCYVDQLVGWDVDLVVTILNLASLAIKLVYQCLHVAPFYWRLMSRKCRSHRESNQGEATS